MSDNDAEGETDGGPKANAGTVGPDVSDQVEARGDDAWRGRMHRSSSSGLRQASRNSGLNEDSPTVGSTQAQQTRWDRGEEGGRDRRDAVGSTNDIRGGREREAGGRGGGIGGGGGGLSDSHPHLVRGTRVTIQGLSKAEHLNGRSAVVKGAAASAEGPEGVQRV